MLRLDRLKKENYAFTTDCDSDCMEKVEEIKKEIMLKNKRKRNEIDDILHSMQSPEENIALVSNSSESG